MKLRSIALAAVLAVSGSAFAVGPGPLGPIGSSAIFIGNTVTDVFDDVYTFSLASSGSISGGVNAINIEDMFNIPKKGLGVSLTGPAVWNSTPIDKTPSSFSFLNLVAGTYALHVVGFADGDDGGIYAGAFKFTAAPVPEPETYALMLAGLGIVGFMASRRKQS